MARHKMEPVLDDNAKQNKNNNHTIMIDDEWGLEFESRNIVVIRKKPNKKGIISTYPLSYHATLEGAVFRIYRLMISESVIHESIETIEGLKNELHSTGTRLINSVARLGSIENGKETD
jgi:glycerol-3-phosphate responsive antiterminator